MKASRNDAGRHPVPDIAHRMKHHRKGVHDPEPRFFPQFPGIAPIIVFEHLFEFNGRLPFVS